MQQTRFNKRAFDPISLFHLQNSFQLPLKLQVLGEKISACSSARSISGELRLSEVMTYKFKKGSKVEVWNTSELPSGSWWCAEILSRNRHTYSVRYDRYKSDMGGVVERAPRKTIRPCPPSVKSPSNWVPGDTVEVFQEYSWKTAEVVRVLGGGYYYVRLVGSSREIIAHMLGLRLPQSWQDDKWVMIGQNLEKDIGKMVSKLPKEGNFSHQMLQPCKEVRNHPAYNHFPIGSDIGFKELRQSFSRGMKRRQYIESCSGVVRKKRAVEEEGRCQQLVAGQIPKLHEKVDAVASPLIMLGGKYTHTSLNNRAARISIADTEKKILNTDDVCCFVPRLESSETESISSSVGSCGTHISPYRSTHPIDGFEDLGSHSDDAETYPVSRSELPPPTKEAVAEEIHRLELNAYRTTLVAFHASGLISWDQEALISNLRLMLNISTDEHLQELRNLVPVKNNAPFR